MPMIASCTTRMTCKVVFWPESALCSELLSAFMVSEERNIPIKFAGLPFGIYNNPKNKSKRRYETSETTRTKRAKRNHLNHRNEASTKRKHRDEYDRGLGGLQNLKMRSSDNLLIRRDPNCETFILIACILRILWQFPHSYQLTQ